MSLALWAFFWSSNTNTPSNATASLINRAWQQPPDPLPTLPRRSVPPGVVVSYAPTIGTNIFAVWEVADAATPQARNLSPALLASAAAVVVSYAPTIGQDIFAVWEVADAAIPQARNLSPALLAAVASDNPPFTQPGRGAWLPTVLAAWQPPDPQPIQRGPLSPGIPGQSVDQPPYLHSERTVAAGIVRSVSQPDAWTYTFAGGWQPYAPAKLNPSVTAVPENNPPFAHPERNAVANLVRSVSQPDPWTYTFVGGGQPFAPRTLPLVVTAVRVDEPPYSQRTALPNILAAWTPPDPLPTLPRNLSPSIPGQSTDQPPFAHSERTNAATVARIVNQPDPWVYSFQGGAQPFAPKLSSVANPGWSVEAPPIDSWGRDPVDIEQQIILQTQPDPWTYLFCGGRQPFEPAKLPPGIPGQSVDQPTFAHPGRNLEAIGQQLASQLQPDPWTYTFQGNRQVYEGRKLSPGIPGQSIDQPPFIHAGRQVTTPALIQAWQLDPWSYSFQGGAQPFGPKLASVANPGWSVDYAPVVHPERSALAVIWRSVAQPDPWTYSFEGGAQPYAGKLASVANPGWSVDVPPVDEWGRELGDIEQQIALQAQPEWNHTFLGGQQPFAPRKLSPGSPGLSVDLPPRLIARFLPWPSDAGLPQQPAYLVQPSAAVGYAVVPSLEDILTTWTEAQRAPTYPRTLSPSIPGQSVDQPPLLSARLTLQWPSDAALPQRPSYLVQPFVGSSSFVPTNFENILLAWQAGYPSPFIGGAQPLSPRLLPSMATSASFALGEADDALAATATVSQPLAIGGGGKKKRPKLVAHAPSPSPSRSDLKRAAIAKGFVATRAAAIISSGAVAIFEQDDHIAARCAVAIRSRIRLREEGDRLSASISLGWPDPTDEEMALILAA